MGLSYWHTLGCPGWAGVRGRQQTVTVSAALWSGAPHANHCYLFFFHINVNDTHWGSTHGGKSPPVGDLFHQIIAIRIFVMLLLDWSICLSLKYNRTSQTPTIEKWMGPHCENLIQLTCTSPPPPHTHKAGTWRKSYVIITLKRRRNNDVILT